jgi:hypothetical protein
MIYISCFWPIRLRTYTVFINACVSWPKMISIFHVFCFWWIYNISTVLTKICILLDVFCSKAAISHCFCLFYLERKTISLVVDSNFYFNVIRKIEYFWKMISKDKSLEKNVFKSMCSSFFNCLKVIFFVLLLLIFKQFERQFVKIKKNRWNIDFYDSFH